jgi:hypothetical protein
MGMAKCATCGHPVRHNSTGSHPGWYHHGPNPATGYSWTRSELDHSASPHDGRTPEGEAIRETAQRDQMKAKVASHLQAGFDHLHAEKTVNDLFNDRR